MLQIVAAILGLSLLVIVHEAGHYLMARAFGIRVTRFSIGFGPAVVRYQPRGSSTVFQICAIPFLAYVAYMDLADAPRPADPTLYRNKSATARALTVLAGPSANYLTASALVFVLALSGFRMEAPAEPMVIDTVAAGSPAANAGLRSGDVVVQANGASIRNLKDLSAVTHPRGGQPTSYVIERDGQRLAPIVMTPQLSQGRGLIGVSARNAVSFEALPVDDAAKLAMVLPWQLTVANLGALADSARRGSTEGISGPIGMGKLVVAQADKGVYDFVWIMILISIALGFFNLLPLPGLDGGRLVFLGYEIITRHRPSERIEGAIHGLGLLLLVAVIALVTFRDVVG